MKCNGCHCASSVIVTMGGYCYILQLVRSNSRRFMPSQADEEAHQLSYLQKHIGNILSLLADSTEGEGDDSLVCEFCCLVDPYFCRIEVNASML